MEKSKMERLQEIGESGLYGRGKATDMACTICLTQCDRLGYLETPRLVGNHLGKQAIGGNACAGGPQSQSAETISVYLDQAATDRQKCMIDRSSRGNMEIT